MSNSMKRLFTFVVMIAMVFSILSGCASPSSQKPAPAVSASTVPAAPAASAPAASAPSQAPAQKGPSKTVNLKFAYNYTDTSMQWPIVQGLKDFMAKNPNIKIVEDPAPGEQLKTKVQVELASGTLADVIAFWAQPALAQAMTESSWLLDVQEFFKGAGIDASLWSPQVLNVIKSEDGKNYVVPCTMSAGFMLYNKELFKKFNLTPPKTFEEWKKVAKVFNDNGIVPFASASNNSIPGHFVWSQIAFQYPNGIEDSNSIGKTSKIDTPAFLTAAKYIAEMRDAGLFPKDTMASGQWDKIYALYGSGKAAMVQIFPFSFGAIKKSGIDAVSGIMDFPKFPGSTVDNTKMTVGQAQDGFCFNAKSWKDPDMRAAMISFGNYVLSDDTFRTMVKNGAMIAKKVDTSSVSVDPFYKMCFDFTKDMALYPFTKGLLKNQAQVTVFQNEIDKLFTGAYTPEQFISVTQKGFDQNK